MLHLHHPYGAERGRKMAAVKSRHSLRVHACRHRPGFSRAPLEVLGMAAQRACGRIPQSSSSSSIDSPCLRGFGVLSLPAWASSG